MYHHYRPDLIHFPIFVTTTTTITTTTEVQQKSGQKSKIDEKSKNFRKFVRGPWEAPGVPWEAHGKMFDLFVFFVLFFFETCG